MFLIILNHNFIFPISNANLQTSKMLNHFGTIIKILIKGNISICVKQLCSWLLNPFSWLILSAGKWDFFF